MRRSALTGAPRVTIRQLLIHSHDRDHGTKSPRSHEVNPASAREAMIARRKRGEGAGLAMGLPAIHGRGARGVRGGAGDSRVYERDLAHGWRDAEPDEG